MAAKTSDKTSSALDESRKSRLTMKAGAGSRNSSSSGSDESHRGPGVVTKEVESTTPRNCEDAREANLIASDPEKDSAMIAYRPFGTCFAM
jgi:hypothetical protein